MNEVEIVFYPSSVASLLNLILDTEHPLGSCFKQGIWNPLCYPVFQSPLGQCEPQQVLCVLALHDNSRLSV